MAVKLAPLFTSPPGGGLNWPDISRPKHNILHQTLIFGGSGRREKTEEFWPRRYMNCDKGKRGAGMWDNRREHQIVSSAGQYSFLTMEIEAERKSCRLYKPHGCGCLLEQANIIQPIFRKACANRPGESFGKVTLISRRRCELEQQMLCNHACK